MFEGFSPRTIDFMWNIRQNNRKPWFEEHKNEYKEDFLHPMKELGKEVFERIMENYSDRGFIHKISRIYKDARYLQGGGPYRDSLWFSIEKPSDEWTSKPVFWFDLGPEKWSYGMGFGQARPLTMAKLRSRIDKAPKEFETLIEPLANQAEFVLEGPEYARIKTAPTFLTAPWYNKKTFSLIHNQQNGPELFSADLANRITGGYEFLMPLYDYFITLDFDPDPALAKAI